jgi:hypothetical protein
MQFLKLVARSRRRQPSPASHALAIGFPLSLVLLVAVGCANTKDPAPPARRFAFERDTIAFPNGLLWIYHYDDKGHWTTETRHPKSDYTQHCFVVARTTRQFFLNARFDPTLPCADDETYRKLIRRVVDTTPRHALPEDQRIVFPGYQDLRSFSGAQERLLKEECGAWWQSYVQRGNWRMVFPFSRKHQQQMAQRLLQDLQRHEPLVVHIARFPQLTINHALVIYDAAEEPERIRFMTYDPNHPVEPIEITYDRGTRTFELAPNDYFRGGRVDLYEIYGKWCY